MTQPVSAMLRVVSEVTTETVSAWSSLFLYLTILDKTSQILYSRESGRLPVS